MFDDVIADIETNKKVSSIVTELFLSGIKLNNSLICLSQSCFKLAKTMTLNATHHWFFMIFFSFHVLFLGKYEFSNGKYVLPEKELLAKASTIKGLNIRHYTIFL